MERTTQQINEEIQALCLEREQVENMTLETTIYTMFSAMTKDEVLMKIKEMMDTSSMLKSEVKRLLIDTQSAPVDNTVVESQEI